MRASGIYKIEHIASGRIYVGSAVRIDLRWNNHRHDLRMQQHCNPKLQRAWNKYGEESFTFSVLELVPNKSDLIKREQYWIDSLRAADAPNFNILKLAGSNLGHIKSESTKQKLRESAIRKNQIAHTRTKKALENHRAAMLRPEYLQMLSVRAKGRPMSDENKTKASARFKGVPKSPEHRAKISAQLKGVPLADETKKKMSIAARNLDDKYKKDRSDRAIKNNSQKNINTPEAIAKRWVTRRKKAELNRLLSESP